jgi:hypothetical protein
VLFLLPKQHLTATAQTTCRNRLLSSPQQSAQTPPASSLIILCCLFEEIILCSLDVSALWSSVALPVHAVMIPFDETQLFEMINELSHHRLIQK